MKKRSKNNSVMAFLVVVVGVVLIGSLLTYAYLKTINTPEYFNPNKKNKAEKLHSSIMTYDLETNYPESPEVVMEIYNNTIELIYGDMIRDETILYDTVRQQRKLLSPKIIEENTLDEQMVALKDALEQLKSDNIYCIGTEQKMPIFDPRDFNKCTIRAMQEFKGIEKVYRNYYFIRNPENRHWQIDEWELTDENYLPILSDENVENVE